MKVSTISHAMLVSPEEADALLTGRLDTLHRSRPSEMRMRVGLLRTDGTLLATAMLLDASMTGFGSTASEWKLGNIEALPTSIAVEPRDGPLWQRLGTADRERILGLTSSGANDKIESAEEDGSNAVLAIAAVVSETPVKPVQEPPRAAMIDMGSEEVGIEPAVPETQTTHHSIEESDPVANVGEPADEGGIVSADVVADDVARARERALAFVPDGMIDVDEAFRLLVRLRDTEIKKMFPEVRPEHGLLRRTMLQTLLDTGVSSREDYDELIPEDLKRGTDRHQLEIYLDPLLAILSHVA